MADRSDRYGTTHPQGTVARRQQHIRYIIWQQCIHPCPFQPSQPPKDLVHLVEPIRDLEQRPVVICKCKQSVRNVPGIISHGRLLGSYLPSQARPSRAKLSAQPIAQKSSRKQKDCLWRQIACVLTSLLLEVFLLLLLFVAVRSDFCSRCRYHPARRVGKNETNRWQNVTQ
eukprot:COSAG06_NODE_361_length_16829_cov_8.781112_5_plen_171_part_00